MRREPLGRTYQASVEHHLDSYARTRDPRARERAFEQSMPMARRLAWRYRRGSEPIDDLLQVAYLGLVAAIDRYDPARGTRFSSFAIPTIVGELRRYFRNTTWSAHVPRSVQEHVLLVRRATDELTARMGRSPSVSDLTRETGLDAEQIAEALHAHVASSAASLDGPLDGEGESDLTLADVLGADDERFELVDRRVSIRPLIRALPRQEREMLFMRFAGGMTQGEIAGRLGCSQMQISRLLRRSLTRLSDAGMAQSNAGYRH